MSPWLRPLLVIHGHTPAAEFGPLALQAVRESMIQNGWVRVQINKHFGRIVRMFKWGAQTEMISASLFHALKTVSGLRRGRSAAKESAPIKPVAKADVDAIAGLVSRQVWAMIRLQLLTGMRSGEACIMRTREIDLNGAVWVYSPSHHKTLYAGRTRRVYLGPRAQQILRPWLRNDADAYLFDPTEAMAEHRASMRLTRKTKVQPSQQNRSKSKRSMPRRYSTTSYAHAIRRAIDRANTERLASAH